MKKRATEFFVALSGPVRSTLQRLVSEESGQDLIEYSLLVVLVSLVATAAISHLGDRLEDTFAYIAKLLGYQLPPDPN
jgi:Flp pilus assembly pilin Flp